MPRMLIDFLPAMIVMTDREDGTEWLLTHRSSDDRIAITDEIPNRWLRGQIHRFGPLEGPYLGRPPRLKLFVRDGRLGFEQVTKRQGVADIDNSLVLTRRGEERYIIEWWEGPWPTPSDRLGWRVILE